MKKQPAEDSGCLTIRHRSNLRTKGGSLANLADRSFGARLNKEFSSTQNEFRSKSKQILEHHFNKENGEASCSNGCVARARYFANSFDGRLYFCQKCAQNLNQQNFEVIPVAGRGKPGRGQAGVAKIEEAQRKLLKEIQAAVQQESQIDDLLGKCLSEIEGSFQNIIGWLREWRVNIYSKVDSEVKLLRKSTASQIRQLEDKALQLQSMQEEGEEDLSRRLDNILGKPQFKSKSFVEDCMRQFREQVKGMEQFLLGDEAESRLEFITSEEVIGLLNGEQGRLLVKQRRRDGSPAREKPLDW